MPVTDNPPNDSRPNSFKLILAIFVLLFVCIIIPCGLFYISFIVTDFLLSLLPYIPLSEENLSIFKIFYPSILIIVMFVILTFYLFIIPKILNIVPLDTRKEWMDYITYKDWKIGFYRKIAAFRPKGTNIFSASYYLESKVLDSIFSYGPQVLIFIFMLIISVSLFFIITSYAGEEYFQFNIFKSQNFINYLNNHLLYIKSVETLILEFFVSLITAIFFLMTLFSFLEMLPKIILKYLFSSKTGICDTSDIPISFIKLAIQQLKAVDFSESFDQIQDKKNKVSNFLNYSMEFVKIGKDNGYPDYMNFCSQKYKRLQNLPAINDIIFRLNGLYENMNKTLIKINHMNSLESKNEIMKDLEIYLKLIENKDLSIIEPIEFKTEELTIDKAFSFLFKKVILPVTLVVLAQLLI